MTRTTLEAAESARRDAPPIMIVPTMVFGVAVVLTAGALWETLGQASWFVVLSLLTGVIAVAGAAAAFSHPKTWRTMAYTVAAPTVIALALGLFAFAEAWTLPGTGLSPQHMAFALVLGCESAIWLAFAGVAISRNPRFQTDAPAY